MNVTFLSPFQVEAVGRNEWKLLQAFTVEVENDRIFSIISVPCGFVTDLASVPRLPGAYLLFGGRARRSAALHDALYRRGADRSYADAVFMAAMKAEGEGKFTQLAMTTAVRLFGWWPYRKHRRGH